MVAYNPNHQIKCTLITLEAHDHVRTRKQGHIYNPMEVVELRVHVHCRACEKAVRKALCKIKGVRCVEIEATLKKITVLGNMDRKVIVKAVRKTGRRAELWASSSSSSRPCRQEDPPSPKPAASGFRFSCF